MGIFSTLFGRKQPPAKVVEPVRPSIAITLSPEKMAEEESANKKANAYVRDAVITSGYIKAEKLSEFFSVVDGFFSVTVHINIEAHLNRGDVLDVAEKKAFGLNTRKKYSKWLVELFEPSAFTKIDPKKWINDVALASWHRAHREKDLARIKKLGIRHVKVLDCGDDRDCKHAAQLAKMSHPIDAVPTLPHAKCDAAYCRCRYGADIKI